jgi:hypothetical protein
MHTMLRRVAVMIAASAWLMVAGEARAERASCDELLAARAAGHGTAEVASTYQTTHARITACERITEHRLRLRERRGDVADTRAARAALRRGS